MYSIAFWWHGRLDVDMYLYKYVCLYYTCEHVQDILHVTHNTTVQNDHSKPIHPITQYLL